MLYSEFVAGTGCRETDYNYKVYRDLEVMYMNSDISKAQIYEYGKKLVDNSKTEEELALEKRIKEEIAEYRAQIAALNEEIERFKDYMDGETEVYWKMHYRDRMRELKQDVRQARQQIRALKWVLG